MNLADIFSYIALFVGLTSSLFFGIGTYNTKDSFLIELSVSMWKSGLRSAYGLIEQKYDYLTGASLLVISFFSQLASKLISDSSLHLKIVDSYSAGLFFALTFSLLSATLVRSTANRLKKAAIAAHTEKIKNDV